MNKLFRENPCNSCPEQAGVDNIFLSMNYTNCTKVNCAFLMICHIMNLKVYKNKANKGVYLHVTITDRNTKRQL